MDLSSQPPRAETGAHDDTAPEVSVVMPAYRAANTISRAISSVQAQSCADWELLVVDDASDDGTVEKVLALARSDPRIRLMRHETNKGAAHARNRAIRAARGRYIAFLDADDEWLPDKLALQISWMRENAIAFSYTSYYHGDGKNWKQIPVPGSVTYADLVRGNVIGCLTAVYDSHALGRVEMPDLAIRQDYALWLKLLRSTPRSFGLETPLARYYRIAGKKTLSSNALEGLMATYRVYRSAENKNPAVSLWFLSNHLVRRIFRHGRAQGFCTIRSEPIPASNENRGENS